MDVKLPPGSFVTLLPLIAVSVGASGTAVALVCTGHHWLGALLAAVVFLSIKSSKVTLTAKSKPTEEP